MQHSSLGKTAILFSIYSSQSAASETRVIFATFRKLLLAQNSFDMLYYFSHILRDSGLSSDFFGNYLTLAFGLDLFTM